MKRSADAMKIYDELADWWPLLSQPDDYAEEAAFFRTLLDGSGEPPHTVLELGSGGGNNASHLKARYQMTLVDISENMLAVSRALNPECEHLAGDMRSVRLGRTFDAVFVHDAVDYMTTEGDLASAIQTAAEHCRSGGVAMFVPDHVRENFGEKCEQGGHDDGRRALRFLEWTHDPDPSDTTYVADFAVMLRDERGDMCLVHDRHVHGLFARKTWLRLFREAGFDPRVVGDRWNRDVFVARRS